MTVAAIDRLVHHSTITEMNGESYRKRSRQAHGGAHRQLKTRPSLSSCRVVVAATPQRQLPRHQK
jgi:hypothetical protein